MGANRLTSNPKVTGAVWLAARLWLGWQFLDHARDKLTSPQRALWIGDQAGTIVRLTLEHSLDLAPGGALAGPVPQVQGWYATLIRHVFFPHAELFSYLVTFGELLVGVALLLGVLTRFAAAMGLVMNFSYLLAGAVDVGPLMVLVAMPLLLVGTTAGFYGVDRYLLPLLRRRLHRLVGAAARRPLHRPSLQTN